MHGVCHASVGRAQLREDSWVLRNPGIVLFHIAGKI
nr:MAG TPA: Flavivirus envelope glycoprotein M [Caudoviricetes sp.]